MDLDYTQIEERPTAATGATKVSCFQQQQQQYNNNNNNNKYI